jgi:hypothetical protein
MNWYLFQHIAQRLLIAAFVLINTTAIAGACKVAVGGKIPHSAVRIIKTGEQPLAAQMQVHPNPVLNELRINLSEDWTKTPLHVELYNGNGQLVKSFSNQEGAKKPVINRQNMASGVYIIRTFNHTDSAVQWIIKK